MTCCPHCGGEVIVTLAAPPQAQPEPQARAIDLIEPCVIAGLLNCSEAHVRRLCERGLKLGIAGIEKRGGRWAATVDAIKDARDMRV